MSVNMMFLLIQMTNLIMMAQESCNEEGQLHLEKVLEMLKSSEIYSPHVGQHIREDNMTSNLVGGLMTIGLQVRVALHQVFLQ